MTDPIVALACGRVRGSSRDGVSRFLGIPYAAPPFGVLRFAPPERPRPWDGIRDATAPGPNLPQRHRPFPKLDVTPLVGSGWREGEDCLTLNIWTPDPSARGLPVMVFIHGGAFVIGEKDAPVHDGSAFARAGVVCVAINYRLGIEGFLPIPGAPTNLALRDQIAALTWVRDNIAAFGGDPGQVTACGESAGAFSLANLITSPLAQGLFRRAIIQSGHGSLVRSIDVARRVVKKLARLLKTSPDVEGFRRKSMDECLTALVRIQSPWRRVDLREADGRDPAYDMVRFLPVHGDDVLPARPIDALRSGAGADIDLLIGCTREEMNLFQVPAGVRQKIGPWMATWALRRPEPNAKAILRAYGLRQPGRKAGEAFGDALTDLFFRMPARRFAAAHRGCAHVYEFAWRSPACDGQLGACHALELPFVFNTLATCTGPRGLAGSSPPQELADRIHGLWAGFVHSGELPWPAYAGDTRPVYELASGTVEPGGDLPAERHVP